MGAVPSIVTERQLRRAVRGHLLVQLGWSHFWLLAGTLAALLAPLALMLLIAYSRV